MHHKIREVELVDYKVLKKAEGLPFFEAGRMPDNSFIAVSWIGIQSLETVVMGGNHVLAMLRERPCAGLLNSNRELIGSWEAAVSWLAHRWAPQAKALGLCHCAHVLSPGIYGRRSFKLLASSLEGSFELVVFEEERDAKAWLQSRGG